MALPAHECAKTLADRFFTFLSEKLERVRTCLEETNAQSDGAQRDDIDVGIQTSQL